MTHLPWLVIVGAPLLLLGGFWMAIDFRSSFDLGMMALAVAIGVAGIWYAPWRREVRVQVTLAYVPLTAVIVLAGLYALDCSRGYCL